MADTISNPNADAVINSAANRTLFLRADATRQMGSGHVMRALALAQAWQARGGRVVFATHCDSATLRDRIDALDITRLDIYSPCPHADDREQTLAFIEQYRPSWAVLDGYHFAPDYQQAVHQSGTRLLVLDDMAHQSQYHADIVLNQNIYAHALTYRCAPRTRLLRGTRYALLRPEFADWRAWRRDVPQSGQNVLVTMGGTDPDNAARKVIQALSSWRGQNFAVKVVVGPGNPHLESLRETVAQCGRDMKLVIAPDDMPALMAWADVAVAAAGTTTLELAYMQTPAVALALADNQVQIANALDAAGTVHNLGWHTALTNRALACAVRDLADSRRCRDSMAQRGRQLVDGEGAGRVISQMLLHSHEQKQTATKNEQPKLVQGRVGQDSREPLCASSF